MLDLFRWAVEHLDRHGVLHGLVGAGAMGTRGFVRATLDLDLLVVDGHVPEPRFWQGLPDGAEADIRDSRLDWDDPLAGLIRLEDEGERWVDVVVGRHVEWQAAIPCRAEPVEVAGVPVPVVQAADLVLLKLFAGSRRDDRDIEDLLAVDPAARELVDARIVSLPPEEVRRWARLKAELDRLH